MPALGTNVPHRDYVVITKSTSIFEYGKSEIRSPAFIAGRISVLAASLAFQRENSKNNCKIVRQNALNVVLFNFPLFFFFFYPSSFPRGFNFVLSSTFATRGEILAAFLVWFSLETRCCTIEMGVFKFHLDSTASTTKFASLPGFLI